MELPQDRTQVIPEIYTGKEQLQRAHDFLMEKLTEVRDDHTNRAQKWLQWDKAYRLIDEQRPDEGSSIVDPEIQVIVDTLVANETESFMGQDPNFKLMGMEETDEEQAGIMSAFIQDSHRRIKLREKFERTIRQKKVFGTAIVKTPYVREFKKRTIREVVERVPQPNGEFKVKTKVRQVDFPFMDDTDWEPVSIFDFYPIGKGSCIEELEGCVQVFKKKYDDLLEKEFKKKDDGKEYGIYHNLDTVKPNQDVELTVAEYWGKIPMSVVTGNEDDRFEKFEGVITAVIQFPDNDNDRRNVKSAHASRTGEMSDEPVTQVSYSGGIRLQENPFWDSSRPFLSCPESPVDSEFYGIGIVEILIEKAIELNCTIRQVLDNKTLQLLNPTIEDRNAGIQRGLKLIKNPRIQANDINGIKTFPINDFSMNGYRAISQIKDDMRRASGAVESIQGVQLGKETSATEFAAVQRQAGIRIASKIKLVDERLFKPFIEKCYKNAQQFSTVEKFIRVLGTKGVNWKPVRPEDIWGTFDIVTKGPNEVENSTIKSNKLIQFLGIAARAPQFANIPFLLQEIWVQMGMPEADKSKVVLAGANETEADVDAETRAMLYGQPAIVKPNQNHQLHIQKKVQAYQEYLAAGGDDPRVEEIFRQNIDGHAAIMATQNPEALAVGGQTPEQGPDMGGMETPNPMAQGMANEQSGAQLA